MFANQNTATRIGMLAGAFATAVLIAFLGLALASNTALAYYAQQDPGTWKSGKETIMLDNKGSNFAYYPNEIAVVSFSGDKITNVKTSNKKVASIKQYGKDSLNITLKKPGKVTISYKYGGKAYKHVLTLVKYQNPVKTFKVGSKNYASKLKKYPGADGGTIAGKKVTVKAASGWKLKNIMVSSGSGEKNIKNGKKIPKGAWSVTAILVNKKTGCTKPVSVYEVVSKKSV